MIHRTRIALAVSMAFAWGAALAQDASTFGFPLAFSPTKMDPSADPRKDFTRYAAGMDVERLKASVQRPCSHRPTPRTPTRRSTSAVSARSSATK